MLRFRRSLSVFTWIFLGACASAGVLPDFPAAMDPGSSATVVVLRNQSFIGMALTQEIRVDGFPIARLGTGQHLRFHLPPGVHSVGIPDVSVSIEFSAGEQYFFEINPQDLDAMEIERLRTEDGLRRIESSQDITPRSGSIGGG